MQHRSSTRPHPISLVSSATQIFPSLIWSKTRQAIPTTPHRQQLTVRCLALPTSQLLHRTTRAHLPSNFFRQLLPPRHLLLLLRLQSSLLPWSTGRPPSWALPPPFRQQSALPTPCSTRPSWLSSASHLACAKPLTSCAWTWTLCRLPCAVTSATCAARLSTLQTSSTGLRISCMTWNPS